MKHLFIIHSHLTFAIIRQYINEAKINIADCLFFCLRNYKIPETITDYKSKEYAYPNDMLQEYNRVWQGWNLKKTRKLLKIVEQFIITKFSNDSFSLYLPNTMMIDLSSVLVTMPQCAGYYIFEEGYGSYSKGELYQKLTSRIKKIIIKLLLRRLYPRFYQLRTDVFCTDYFKFKGTIATSNLCFPGIKGERIIIGLPFSKCELNIIPNIVLSIDASLLRIFSIYEAEAVYKKIKKIIPHNAQIAYKFHPLFYKNEIQMNQYRVLLQSIFGPNLFELSSGTILEEVLGTYHCDFYSDLSSVALYSFPLGIHNYSYAHYLMETFHNIQYEKEYINAPKIIKDCYIEI